MVAAGPRDSLGCHAASPAIGAKTDCDLTLARADQTIGEVLPVTKKKS
jgi:hypothetical protein